MDLVPPPPLPKSRQSLRERCRTSLAILPTSYREWNTVCYCDCKLFMIPKKKRKEEVDEVDGEEEEELEDEEEEDESEDEEEQGEEDDYYDEAHQVPPPSPTPSLDECNHILEIKRGLYIALVDDEADLVALRTFDLKSFTHLVQVSYAMSIGNDNEQQQPSTSLMRLRIVCPAASLHLRADQTAVDLLQLGVARDFLALALPHGSAKWWPEEQRRIGKVGEWRENRHAQDEQDLDADAQFVVLAPGGPDEFQNEQNEPELRDDMDINALIVAPTSRAVDVVSILYCYLAFLEDTRAENLTFEHYYDRVWAQVSLGPRTMGQVNLMARSV